MQISSRIICVLQSSPNGVHFWVQVFCCNMTMLGSILPVQLLQQSKICPSSVFHICHTRPKWFSRLWTTQRGKSFRFDGAVHEWLRSQPKDFFPRGIHALPKCWNTCMESNGDYIEKWCHCVPFVFSKLWDKNISSFHLIHLRYNACDKSI